MVHRYYEPYVVSVIQRLTGAGISDAVFVSGTEVMESFGNCELVFAIGELMLKVVRDRMWESVEIGPSRQPGVYYFFEDVERAFGWESGPLDIGGVPEPIENEFQLIARERARLEDAWTESQQEKTRVLLGVAATQREEALRAHWRKLSDEHDAKVKREQSDSAERDGE